MADVVIFATGDEIGTYSGLSMSGNSNGVKLTLTGVEPLGSATDIFRIVIRQVTPGETQFTNGQFVDIYAWPDSSDPPVPIFSSLNPQHDQFQGRASSAEHQIFTSPTGVVFDLDGITAGTVRYGPGLDPPRDQKLAFSSFSPTPPTIPCFAAGTLIDTADGPRRIETLCVGDLVHTADDGPQPIRWTGGTEVVGRGPFAPVRFAAGSLGNHRPLVVSQQHRILVGDWRSALFFGQEQVLVAARHLVNGGTVRLMPVPRIAYHHMVFDRHQIVFSEGIPTESLHLGSVAVSALDRAARAEVLALFPGLGRGLPPGHTARTCLRAWEGRLVA